MMAARRQSVGVAAAVAGSLELSAHDRVLKNNTRLYHTASDRAAQATPSASVTTPQLLLQGEASEPSPSDEKTTTSK